MWGTGNCVCTYLFGCAQFYNEDISLIERLVRSYYENSLYRNIITDEINLGNQKL